MTAEFWRIYLLYWVICHEAYLYWQVLSDCWVDLYMFAGHNCLCDIADEQPLLYYCWSQLAVWHRRRTPSGLIYICSLVTTVCVTSPTNNLCYITVGHNWLCDIVGEHHLGWFICWCATAGFLYYQSLPSTWHCWNALAGFINSHNCLCDIYWTEQLGYFISITVTV